MGQRAGELAAGRQPLFDQRKRLTELWSRSRPEPFENNHFGGNYIHPRLGEEAQRRFFALGPARSNGIPAHGNPAARPNYDLYWMNVETGKKVRITYAPGADVLPVFSPDSKRLMWTSTRDGRQPAQLYLADFTPPKDDE